MYAPTAIPVVDGNKGITVFAPVNSAFAVAAAIVGTLNTTQISNVLLNHVITGVTAYSTSLSNSLTATSASGEPLSFIVNATGAYVVSGPVVAKIIRSDVIVAYVVFFFLLFFLLYPLADMFSFSLFRNIATVLFTSLTASWPTPTPLPLPRAPLLRKSCFHYFIV